VRPVSVSRPYLTLRPTARFMCLRATLFARLLIKGCVAELDVPVQARVQVVLVMISLISGSSVASGPKTRGEVRNTATVTRCNHFYVAYV